MLLLTRASWKKGPRSVILGISCRWNFLAQPHGDYNTQTLNVWYNLPTLRILDPPIEGFDIEISLAFYKAQGDGLAMLGEWSDLTTLGMRGRGASHWSVSCWPWLSCRTEVHRTRRARRWCFLRVQQLSLHTRRIHQQPPYHEHSRSYTIRINLYDAGVFRSSK